MENNSSAGRYMKTTGGTVSGNIAFGDNSRQWLDNSSAVDTEEIYRLMRTIEDMLEQQPGDVPDAPGGRTALNEFAGMLKDGTAQSHPGRLRSALTRLRGAIGDASTFTLPLAELAVAVERLLQGRP